MNSATTFNFLDIAAAIAIVLGAVMGYRRGLIGQLVPLLVFIVVACTTVFGYTPCHDWLARVSSWSHAVVRLVTIVLVVVIPLAAMILLGRRLVEWTNRPVLVQLDSAAGTLTGLAGGALAVVLALLALSDLPERYRPETLIKGSWVGRQVMAGKQQAVNTMTRRIDDARDVLLWSHRSNNSKDPRGNDNWER